MRRSWRHTDAEHGFETILATCLEEAGDAESLRACLARYPEHAARLEPLLQTVLGLRQRLAVPVREQRRLEARRQFLQAAARHAERAPAYVAGRTRPAGRLPVFLQRPLWSSFAPAAVAALLFLVAIVPVTALTSTSALPGDWNYGFKRSSERVRLALTLDSMDRLDLQLAFHQRRLGEIERLASEGRLTDPTLLKSFQNETTLLVNTVSNDPALGPSEALKVAQVSEAQAQALADQVEPKVSQNVKPAVAAAVDQSQQIHAQAVQVARVKEQTQAARPAPAASRSASPAASARNATAAAATSANSTRTPATATTSAADATAAPSTTPAATATATATAGGTPAATGTAGPSTAPIQPPPVPPARIPSATAVAAGPAPLLIPPPPPAPLRPSATVGLEQISPSRTPIPAPSIAGPRAPAPSPTPLVVPAQPPPSSSVYSFLLAAGAETSLVYIGPSLPVPAALASISGAYEVVYFTQPSRGGNVYTWYPGRSDPSILLERNSLITIRTKPGVPAILTYVIMP